MNKEKRLFTSAIIPAAGQGSRMKKAINKQYLTLKGKAILAYTLDIFEDCPLIDEVIVVVNPDEFEICGSQVLSRRAYKKVRLTAGGASRQASVFEGLKAVSPQCRLAVIHDGARPLLSQKVLQQCIKATWIHHATVAAVPAKNTIKVVDTDGKVQLTPDRSTLYEVHTPQTFDYDLIMDVHQRACQEGFSGTDDASLAEHFGYPVQVVRDRYQNIKITTPEDLLIAEAMIGFSR